MRRTNDILHERDSTIQNQSSRISGLEEELRDTEQALRHKTEMSNSEISDLTEKNKLLIDQKLKLHEEVQQANDELEHT